MYAVFRIHVFSVPIASILNTEERNLNSFILEANFVIKKNNEKKEEKKEKKNEKRKKKDKRTASSP